MFCRRPLITSGSHCTMNFVDLPSDRANNHHGRPRPPVHRSQPSQSPMVQHSNQSPIHPSTSPNHPSPNHPNQPNYPYQPPTPHISIHPLSQDVALIHIDFSTRIRLIIAINIVMLVVVFRICQLISGNVLAGSWVLTWLCYCGGLRALMVVR
jgi:hypothetical protein